MVCLVIVSLQSYKNQIGTNVPDLSNSPGKLTDPFFFQQKGPATQKSLIISYQGINLPAPHSDGTRELQSPGSASAGPREEEVELLPLSMSTFISSAEEPNMGRQDGRYIKVISSFFPIILLPFNCPELTLPHDRPLVFLSGCLPFLSLGFGSSLTRTQPLLPGSGLK